MQVNAASKSHAHKQAMQVTCKAVQVVMQVNAKQVQVVMQVKGPFGPQSMQCKTASVHMQCKSRLACCKSMQGCVHMQAMLQVNARQQCKSCKSMQASAVLMLAYVIS